VGYFTLLGGDLYGAYAGLQLSGCKSAVYAAGQQDLKYLISFQPNFVASFN
jgi:hypothetical protein